MDISTMLSLSKVAALVKEFLKKAFSKLDMSTTTSVPLLELTIQTIFYSDLKNEMREAIKHLPIEDILLLCEVREALESYTRAKYSKTYGDFAAEESVQGLISLCMYVLFMITSSIFTFLENNNLTLQDLSLVSDMIVLPREYKKIDGGYTYLVDNKTIYQMGPIKLGKLELSIFFIKGEMFKNFEN